MGIEQSMIEAKQKEAAAYKDTYAKSMTTSTIRSLRQLLTTRNATFAFDNSVLTTRATNTLSKRLNNAAALEIRPEWVIRDLSYIAGAINTIKKD